MGYRYAVLGAGRQGVAAAYDLASFGEADAIALFDLDKRRAQQAAARVNQLSGRQVAQASQLDVQDEAKTIEALEGFHSCMNAVPYRFNVGISRAAIRARVSLCDLGGSTETVLEQLELDKEAKMAGIAIVPDCGLAPGTANLLAVYAMNLLEALGGRPEEVKIYCGGLPQRPKPPLDYKLLFSLEGLLNEYLSPVHVLRDGRVQELEPLTELEPLEFPEPVGRCEAFLTSGGTSTGPWTFQGKLKRYEYKTVRYPGHLDKIRTLRDLGLLDAEPIDVGRIKISPREVFQALADLKLRFPEDPDVVVLRVICRGHDPAGRPIEVQLDHTDFHDESTGFTAMERTTGFSAAIVAHMLARGEIAPGAHTPEQVVPVGPFMRALLERGFRITEAIHQPLA